MPPCHQNPIGASGCFSLKTVIFRPGSIGLLLVAIIEPSMHAYLWNAKGSELHMWPLHDERHCIDLKAFGRLPPPRAYTTQGLFTKPLAQGPLPCNTNVLAI